MQRYKNMQNKIIAYGGVHDKPATSAGEIPIP